MRQGARDVAIPYPPTACYDGFNFSSCNICKLKLSLVDGSNVASLFPQTLRPFLAAFSCSSKSCMVEDASCQRGNKLHENVQKCKKQKFMLCCDFRSVTVCSLTFSFFLRISSSWSRGFLSSEKMSINASCSLVADSSCLCRSSSWKIGGWRATYIIPRR